MPWHIWILSDPARGALEGEKLAPAKALLAHTPAARRREATAKLSRAIGKNKSLPSSDAAPNALSPPSQAIDSHCLRTRTTSVCHFRATL